MSDLAASSVNPNITPNFMVNDTKNTNSSVPYYRGNLDYPPDTVQFKGQEVQEKKGLSKGAKWGIGTAVVLAAGVCAYFLTRGKIGSKQVQQLAEHIDFKEAKTVEEAIEFGKKHLGIKKYKGFEEKDLNVINWINEGLVNTSNKMKGKLNTTREVHYVNGNANLFASVDPEGRILKINKTVYGDIDTAINNYLKDSSYVTLDIKTGECTIPAIYGAKSEDMVAILKKISEFRENKLNYREKIRLFTNLEHITEEVNAFHLNPLNKVQRMLNNPEIRKRAIKNALETDINKISKMSIDEQVELLDEYMDKCNVRFKYRPVSEFRPIYHELGHINDPNVLQRAMRPEQYKNTGEYPQELKEWLGDENNTKVASLVSQYATSNPAEFIAETFATMCEEQEIQNGVMALYKKYGGPVVS